MALTKQTEIYEINSNPKTGAISVRTDTLISEDDVELSRTHHRHALTPYFSSKSPEGVWTHKETDISEEEEQVQNVANALWTDKVKEAFKQEVESSF